MNSSKGLKTSGLGAVLVNALVFLHKRYFNACFRSLSYKSKFSKRFSLAPGESRKRSVRLDIFAKEVKPIFTEAVGEDTSETAWRRVGFWLFSTGVGGRVRENTESFLKFFSKEGMGRER